MLKERHNNGDVRKTVVELDTCHSWIGGSHVSVETMNANHPRSKVGVRACTAKAGPTGRVHVRRTDERRAAFVGSYRFVIGACGRTQLCVARSLRRRPSASE